jgi:hypothetical protein
MRARQGIVIDRSTLASWVGYAAAELKPLWRLLRDQLLGSQAVRRRDDGAGARSGLRPDQDRLLLGDHPRRPAVGRR